MARKTLYGEKSLDELNGLREQNSIDWHSADPERQAQLHQDNIDIQEEIDRRTGGKSTFDPGTGLWGKSGGGTSGGAYTSGGKPGGFTYEEAPKMVDQYGDFLQQAIRRLQGREPFSYDPEKDPVFLQYRDQFTRGGQKAMEGTLAQVATRTGGMASTYATSAAQQANNAYMQKLADKIPELRDAAYQMWLNEGNQLRSDIGLFSDLQGADRDWFIKSQLNPWQTDRQFAYGVNRDAVADARYDAEREHQLEREGIEDARYDTEWQHTLDREAVADARYDQEYADERADVQFSRDLAAAQLAGDKAGIFDLYKTAFPNLSDEAIQEMTERAAQDNDYAKQMRGYELQGAALDLQLKQKSLSGGSGGSSMGVKGTTEDTQSKSYSSVLNNAKGYKKPDEAKSYLERMVDGGYITPDEAAYIYQVELGGQADYGSSVPTSYAEFYAMLPNTKAGIFTAAEFGQNRGGVKTQYGTYKNYLEAMYQKWK